MVARCQDCKQPLESSLPSEPRPWFRVDGTTAIVCRPCITEVVQVAGITASLRRIHCSAHGWDAPPEYCPVCIEQAGAPKRAAEAAPQLSAPSPGEGPQRRTSLREPG